VFNHAYKNVKISTCSGTFDGITGFGHQGDSSSDGVNQDWGKPNGQFDSRETARKCKS
jgi:hypothetical protein